MRDKGSSNVNKFMGEEVGEKEYNEEEEEMEEDTDGEGTEK